jgi:hypothetical protein
VTVGIREAIHQHAIVVEKVIGEHMLWCPQIVDVMDTVQTPYKRTFLRLNDGRECEVLTQIAENDGHVFTIQTRVSEWKRVVI